MIFVAGLLMMVFGILILMPTWPWRDSPTPRVGFGLIWFSLGAMLVIVSVGMFLWRVMP